MSDQQTMSESGVVKYPSVSVIVLNYNGLKFLPACLSSLESQTYPNRKIIVYDNGSTDGSVAFIKRNFPGVLLIEGKENVGFAKGNNMAISFALRENPEYIFLVNNDTEAENALLEKLVKTLQNTDSLDIVSPAVFNLTHKDILQELGMTIDRFGYPLALRASQNLCKVFFVSGCAMMIKSELLKKIGSFDQEYFMFAEDLDLCWRAQLAGYKIGVNPAAKIYHAAGGSILGGVVSTSSYETNVRRVFLREKNTIRTLIKNYDLGNVFKTVPLYIMLLCFEAIFWLSLLKAEVTVSEISAIYYNIKTLPDTLQQRRLVQSLRVSPDRSIQKHMIRGYGKLIFFRTMGIPRFRGSK